jgi:hypothetical protein
VPLSRTKPYSARVAPRSVAGPLCTQVKDGRRTVGLMQGLYFDAKRRSRPAIKAAAGRSSRTHVVSPASAHCRGAVPFGQHRRRPTHPTAALDPARAARAALLSSQAGCSPEQSSPRPCSLRAAAWPAASVPPPVSSHKPSHGEPLVLPHLFPGQGRRRSRKIPASRAALNAQGLHYVSLVLSRVFFVNQGPICIREKISRGLCESWILKS